VHPAKPKVGLRTTRADEMWHIDTSVTRLLDGTRAYVHAVTDNFAATDLGMASGRYIRAGEQRGRVARRQSRRDALRHNPVVLADAGVENVNAQVDALISTGVLRRVLAFTELKFSNSMIEAGNGRAGSSPPCARYIAPARSCLSISPAGGRI
jgi:hypothetical protein